MSTKNLKQNLLKSVCFTMKKKNEKLYVAFGAWLVKNLRMFFYIHMVVLNFSTTTSCQIFLIF